MALNLATLMTQFKSLVKNQGGTVRNIVMVLIVYSMQAIITSKSIFKCPSVGYKAYGAMFVFLPGTMLFFIALFLNEGFWKIARGCCFYEEEDPNRDAKKRYLPCFFPRWGCSKKLVEVIFYSLIATGLWVFWAFLKMDYYICYKLGRKTARLVNVTAEQKKKILVDYQRAGDASQVIAFILLAVMIFLPFTVLTAYRCCCQRPTSKIPSPYEYMALESKSAVETFEGKMKELAAAQGKRRAEMYFAEQTRTDKNPSEILIQAYEDLTKIEKYSEAFPALEDYKKVEADAAVAAFKTHAETAGKERVEITFVDKTWTDYERKDPFGVVENVYESMIDRYPRSTGDRSQPYIKENELAPTKAKNGAKGLPEFEMSETEEV